MTTPCDLTADACEALERAALTLRDSVIDLRDLPEPHPATLRALEAVLRQAESPNEADDAMVGRTQGRRLGRALATTAAPGPGVPSSHVAPREASWSARSYAASAPC